jgi:plastocyanin
VTSIRRLPAAASLIVALAACSGGGAAASITPPPGVDASVTAQDNSFVQKTFELPAGKPAALFFKNLDGQPHNIAIYVDAAHSQSLFVGENVTNAAQTYAVPALDAGQYFFRCDVHPDMTGTVKAGS